MTPDAMIVIDDVEKFRDKMEDLYKYLHIHNIPYQLEKTDSDDSIMLLHKRDFLYMRIVLIISLAFSEIYIYYSGIDIYFLKFGDMAIVVSTDSTFSELTGK